MKERDVAAFVVGIILGGIATYLDIVAAAWFALPGMFVLCGLLFPLFASLLSERRTILAGLVPNLVMMLCLTTYFLIFSTDRPPWSEMLYLLVIMSGAGISLSLLVSVPIHLLRQKMRKETTPQHVFSRDAQQIGPERVERGSQLD